MKIRKPYKSDAAAAMDNRPLYNPPENKSNTAMKIRPPYVDPERRKAVE